MSARDEMTRNLAAVAAKILHPAPPTPTECPHCHTAVDGWRMLGTHLKFRCVELGRGHAPTNESSTR